MKVATWLPAPAAGRAGARAGLLFFDPRHYSSHQMNADRTNLSLSEQGLAVIADDLTGATDCAAAFVRAGFRSSVLLNHRQRTPLETEVAVVSTYSRQDTPWLAARKVRAACALLARRGCTVIYKKMDSTVQGNIVAEVVAVCQAVPFATALICPANPGQGRVIKGGELFVWGKHTADLPSLFRQQGLVTDCVLHRLSRVTKR